MELRATEPAAVEVPLHGGRITQGVVRVGDTVRRPAGPHTPYVHRLLEHLETVGFEGAPRVLGFDEQDREVLSFVDGWVPPDLTRWSDGQLVQAARLLRRFHDATAGSELVGASQVACHNDPSPCNFVFRDGWPVALIDFDGAGAGERLDDVAYAGWMWVLSQRVDGRPVTELARQLGLFLDAYRPGLRRGISERTLEVQEHHRRLIERSDDPAVAEYARAGSQWMRKEQQWLRQHRAELDAQLLA